MILNKRIELTDKIAALFFISCSLVLLGFDYSKHSIPLNEIKSGGPPQDGIPALFDPKFVNASEATYLKDSDRVLGLSFNGKAKAYPIKILNWHELVNDTVGEREVLVSYCPLCGTGMSFDARIKGERYLFGVSGKLYNSDVLMYDKKTESLWSQIQMEAVTGPLTGTKLKLLVQEHTTWKAWKDKYPQTLVLSQSTGHKRNYNRDPYASYRNSPSTMFPVNHTDSRLSYKTWIIGLLIGNKAKAYSLGKLSQITEPLKDQLGGQKIIVYYDHEHQSAVIKDSSGNIIPSIQAYWFAWAAFYPDTELYY